MREFALADASTGIDLVFADVTTMADACRFATADIAMSQGAP